jgi:hypothetical protein
MRPLTFYSRIVGRLEVTLVADTTWLNNLPTTASDDSDNVTVAMVTADHCISTLLTFWSIRRNSLAGKNVSSHTMDQSVYVTQAQ